MDTPLSSPAICLGDAPSSELRRALNIILQSSELVNAPEAAPALHQLQHGVGELANLVDCLAALAAAPTPPQPVDLAALLQTLSPLAEPYIQKRQVRFQLSYPIFPSPGVMAVPDTLEQVLAQLAAVGLCQTPHGGRFSLTLQGQGDELCLEGQTQPTASPAALPAPLLMLCGAQGWLLEGVAGHFRLCLPACPAPCTVAPVTRQQLRGAQKLALLFL